MNKWVKRFGILAVLGYCGIMLIVGGSLAFILGIIGIVGVAGLYAFATLMTHLFKADEKTDLQNLPPPSNICPTCGHALTFVEQYKAWYCSNCKDYK